MEKEKFGESKPEVEPKINQLDIGLDMGRREVLGKIQRLIRNMGRSNLISKTKLQDIIDGYEEDGRNNTKNQD